MESEFSQILAKALQRAASVHGQSYPDGGAQAWGEVGAAYLGFALCGLPSTRLRALQYDARDSFGPVILLCKWYDDVKSECMGSLDSVKALIPAPGGKLQSCTISRQILLETLDFCREG